MKLVDAIGREHSRVSAATPPRIVSLVPSLTELLCTLGLGPYLVGRTGFCVHPAGEVAAVVKVGGTKSVNITKMRALAPTHVIVNVDENEKPTVDILAQFIPNVIVTHPLSPLDNPALYRLLGGIFGAGSKAEELCAAFEVEYAQLMNLPRPAPKTVLYCIWKDPWMTVSRDTYIAEMLNLIGWTHWIGHEEPAPRYPAFEWSKPLLAAVDEILLSSEPFRFSGKHVAALARQTGKPVRLIDGELISWYGSRAIEGLRYLRRLAEEPAAMDIEQSRPARATSAG
jgi:ABC-type Fe3+-hydroxamate transport system substrate-binding protein